MSEENQLLTRCLYFTASRFARNMTRLAEKTFEADDLAPTYLYLIMIVKFNPGIRQKELCRKLSIAPSTSTRFVSKLEKRKLVTRTSGGKDTYITLTDSGEAVYSRFQQSLEVLFARYSAILGSEFSTNLSKRLYEASVKLEQNY
ncbi:MarR family transcriptional regulator [Sporolactobacillus shoreicorticis]|uniref:MarR family winged helix-turn-helix transcriptional regulator n=1 Tax=Sporolactobacillus shoreicorticis TaxID=1923877 RepID=A0ABW5S231_9BACL|nr:MarR family transcriptional regulator [Sporolactobacillus shoreicorticis]MCO7124617.1 MarR family transcriptional regulator [Sporolactobacillus shoreicorticis]